jgi:hypothetical protein
VSVAGVKIAALNLKQEADALYGEYLHNAIRLCCAGRWRSWCCWSGSAPSTRRLFAASLPGRTCSRHRLCTQPPPHEPTVDQLLLIFAVAPLRPVFDRGGRRADRNVAVWTLVRRCWPISRRSSPLAVGDSHVPVLSALQHCRPGAFPRFFRALWRRRVGARTGDVDAG